jgi:SWI/SNF-related matrix-associated actin-dependent regulator 1 of chromatin subfamily A
MKYHVAGGGEKVGATVKQRKRKLLADGRIMLSYDPASLPLLRALPPPHGKKSGWDPQRKCWVASTALSDKKRVLEIADKLGLEVALEWHKVSQNEAKTEARFGWLTEQAGIEPYDFQREGCQWLAVRSRALLGDDMGLGKTMQVLWSLPEGAKTLVVCPASLKYNWEAEVGKWRPDFRTTVLEGRGSFRLPEAGEVLITNYELLPKAPEKGQKSSCELTGVSLVVDEATYCKSHKAARSKAVRALAATAEKVWLLTGTPLLGRPFDLWGVLSAGGMQQDVFGGWMTFLRCFGAYKNRWGGYEFKKPLPEVPERLRRVMLRRRKEEVLKDLPALRYQDLVLDDLDAELQTSLDDAWDEWQDSTLDKLPDFSQFSELRRQLAESRIPRLLELVEQYEEAGEPLVVFSAHRAPVEVLTKREGWAAILGGTPAQERHRIVQDFQNGYLRGLALTITAGGFGLTLTKASHVLFVDLSWTPGENSQALDRVRRIGQQANSILCTRLVSRHPLDQHVLKLISSKEAMIHAAVESSINPAQERREQALVRAARQAKNIVEQEERQRQYSQSKTDIDLTDEVKLVLEQAYTYMQSVCDGAVHRDGQGFNKPDAARAAVVISYAKELYDAGNPEGYRALTLMLRRYRRQLEGRFPILFSEEK